MRNEGNDKIIDREMKGLRNLFMEKWTNGEMNRLRNHK